jgi:hypothetical protein
MSTYWDFLCYAIDCVAPSVLLKSSCKRVSRCCPTKQGTPSIKLNQKANILLARRDEWPVSDDACQRHPPRHTYSRCFPPSRFQALRACEIEIYLPPSASRWFVGCVMSFKQVLKGTACSRSLHSQVQHDSHVNKRTRGQEALARCRKSKKPKTRRQASEKAKKPHTQTVWRRK